MSEVKEKTLVSAQDVSEAYGNFAKVFFPGEVERGLEFWDFLERDGQKYEFNFAGDGFGGWEMPPAQIRIVKALCSPNYLAIAKLLQARGHRWKDHSNGI